MSSPRGVVLVCSLAVGLLAASSSVAQSETDPVVGLVPRSLDLSTGVVFQENRDRIDGAERHWLIRFKDTEFIYSEVGDADLVAPIQGKEKIEGIPVKITSAGSEAIVWQTPEDFLSPLHALATNGSADTLRELAERVIRHLKSGSKIEMIGDGVEVAESYRLNLRALSITFADQSRIKSIENPPPVPQKLAEVFTAIFGEPPGVPPGNDALDGWIWDGKDGPPDRTAPATRSLRLSEVKKLMPSADKRAKDLIDKTAWVKMSKDVQAGINRGNPGGQSAETACLRIKTDAVCSIGPFVSRLIKGNWYVLDAATDYMTVESKKGKLKILAKGEVDRRLYTLVQVPKDVQVVRLTIRRSLRFEIVTIERPLW
jgi:hypothetical protein